MATYVLVHGGAHGGWCYQKVARILRSGGHDVYAPTLTGLGERSHLVSPKVDLDLHVTDVVNVLQFEDLEDVVLVGHSYGGMVITGAADRATGRVRCLVYLDAVNPKNGESVADIAPRIEATHARGATVDGVELVLFPGTDPLGFFGVRNQADIEWMKPKLTPHPWKCFEQKLELHNEAALWAIPQYHVVCTSSVPNRDPELIDKARADGRLWEIDTGHDLMITEPHAVADALLEIARS